MPLLCNSTEGLYLGIFVTKVLEKPKEQILEGKATRNVQLLSFQELVGPRKEVMSPEFRSGRYSRSWNPTGSGSEPWGHGRTSSLEGDGDSQETVTASLKQREVEVRTCMIPSSPPAIS